MEFEYNGAHHLWARNTRACPSGGQSRWQTGAARSVSWPGHSL